MEWKYHDDMTVEECRMEVESLESYFESCREIGQGINTKESVRHRMCQLKVKLHDEMDWSEERIMAIPNLLEFERGMRALLGV